VAVGVLVGLAACGAGLPADDEADAAPPRCGDGIRQEELGEFCDQGALNGTEGATCTTECWEPRIVFDAPPVRFQLPESVDEIIWGQAYMPSGRAEVRVLDSAQVPTTFAPVSAPPTSFASYLGEDVFWIEEGPGGQRLYCRPFSAAEPRELSYPFPDGTRGELVQVDDNGGGLAVLVDHTAEPQAELLAAIITLRCGELNIIRPISRLGAAPGSSVATVMARSVWTTELGQHVHIVVIYDDTDRFVAIEGGIVGDSSESPFERVAEGAWTAKIVDWAAWDPHLFTGGQPGHEAPLAMLTPEGEVLLWRFREGSPSEARNPHFAWVAPGTQVITAPMSWESILAFEPDGTLAVLFNGSTGWPLTALRRQQYALSPPYAVASSDPGYRWLVTADDSMFMLPFAALPDTLAVRIEGIPY
jgi:hypothetical protein